MCGCAQAHGCAIRIRQNYSQGEPHPCAVGSDLVMGILQARSCHLAIQIRLTHPFELTPHLTATLHSFCRFLSQKPVMQNGSLHSGIMVLAVCCLQKSPCLADMSL